MSDQKFRSLLHRRLRALIVLSLLPGLCFAAQPLEIGLGEPLRDALDRYGPAGFNVVSTTLVLPHRLTVTVIPDPEQDLPEQIRSLLQPHGLDLELIDASTGYVKLLEQRPVASAASVEPSAPGSQSVEEIVVTSQYRIRRRSDTQHALDHEELSTLPSLGRDTLRGLDVLPGVSSSGISARQRFRGGDVNEVLYRLDGVELLEPFHMRSLQEMFSAINLNVVDAADVYVAGFPVSMGARMSGVVDLIPVEPSTTFQGGIDLNQVSASLDMSGWQGDWSWLASARRGLLEYSLDLFDTDYGEPRFDDQFVRIVRDTGDDRVVFGLLNSNDRIVIRDDVEYGQSHAEYQAGWLRWEHNYNPGLQSEWQVSLIAIDNSRAGVIDSADFSIGNLIERRRFQTIDVRNDWQWQVTAHTDLNAGWGVAFNDGEFGAQVNAQYGAIGQAIQNASTLQRTLNEDRDGESLVAYLSLRQQFSPRLSAEIGLRYDGQDIDPVHVNEVSARANLAYQATPALKLALNVGRYTQQQHLYEIQIDDGKAELDPPQHSDQINLTGMWQPWPDARVRLDLYYRKIRNPWSHYENLYNRWVLLPELRPDRFEIVPERASTRGAELAFSQQASANLTWQVSYVIANAKEDYLGTSNNRPWHQNHSFKAGLQWHNERWRAGINLAYHSGWPVSPRIDQPDQLPARVFRDKLPTYFTVNAHVSRLFPFATGTLELYMDVMNLSDRENIGGYDYFSDGGRDQQRLLPLMPTLGISYRW